MKTPEKRLTDKQRTEYTRIGLALCKIACNNKTAELLWRMQRLIREKGGSVSLMDTVKLEAIVNKKFSKKRK